MNHVTFALLAALAGCQHAGPDLALHRQAVTASGLTVLHTLSDEDGNAIRGAGVELDGRIYWLAGERGPNGTPNCSSTAHWNDIEHKAHCPGSLISIGLDGSDFRVDYAFSQLDDHGQNPDGYHPYGSPIAVAGCLVGVTQVGGVPVGAGAEAATARGVGTLWRYCPSTRAFSVLHNFFGAARAFDGMYPMGTAAALPDGRVCGATKDGGSGHKGTIWCWSPAAPFTYVALTPPADADPGTGSAYGGVTYAGGRLHFSTNDGGEFGAGTYSTVDPDAMSISVVDSWPAFTGSPCCNDNTSIQSPTLLGNGELVMARQFQGAWGSGVLVKLQPTGISVLKAFDEVTVLASPRFSNLSGGMPNGRVTGGTHGMVLGTVSYGGAAGAGGIYEIASDGSRFRFLHSFQPGGPSYPYGGLTTASNGAVYGSTFNGGILFRFDPPAAEACP